MAREETISTVELAQSLDVTPQRVAAWIKQGMPVESRNGTCKFRAWAVERWLLKRGLITERVEQTGGRICRTRAEAARMLGVHQQTITDWANGYADFPGRAGTPGKRDGYYPIDEIETWREGACGPGRIGGGSGVLDVERGRLLNLQCEERELRLQQKRAALVPVQEVTDFLRRTVAQAASMLDELPDRILASLPADVGGESRRAIRSDVAGVVRDVRIVIGELVSGDADEQTEG